MSKNIMNALLVLFWALAMLGVYMTDEWIDTLPKIERRMK